MHPKAKAAQELAEQLLNPQPAPTPAPEPATPTPAMPAAAAPPAPPAPERGEAYWQQRVSTLEGMIRVRDSDIAGLKSEREHDRLEIDRLNKAIEQAHQRIATMPAPPINLADYFTAEEIDDIGEVEAMRLAKISHKAEQRAAERARQAAEDVMRPVTSQVEARRAEEQQEADRRRREAKVRFATDLEAIVPGYTAWAVGEGADPRFLQWLGTRVPGTTITYSQQLIAAEQASDAVVVGEILNAFLKGMGVDTTPRNPNSRLSPSGVPGSGGPPVVVPAVPGISLAEITQFQNDFARGKYRGRAKEAADMQRRIDEAYSVGRVQT